MSDKFDKWKDNFIKLYGYDNFVKLMSMTNYDETKLNEIEFPLKSFDEVHKDWLKKNEEEVAPEEETPSLFDDDALVESLGKPDEFEVIKEDGFNIEKRVWNVGAGRIVKVQVVSTNGIPDMDKVQKTLARLREEEQRKTDDMFSRMGQGEQVKSSPTPKPQKEFTLEEKLQNAIDEEDYVEAAKLRDLIKAETDKDLAKQIKTKLQAALDAEDYELLAEILKKFKK